MSPRAVALFDNKSNAEPGYEWLVQQGFSAQIREKPPFRSIWSASPVIGGVRLEVPMDQFERAEQAVLAQDAETNILRQAIRCPECHSLRAAYPQYARHSLLTNLAMGMVARLGLIKRHYFCEKCQFMWCRDSDMQTQPAGGLQRFG